MAQTKGPSQQRARQEVARRRAAQAARARTVQRHQAEAAASRQRVRSAGGEARRRALAYGLWALAAVAAIADLLVYLGVITGISTGAALFVLGGPMVGLAFAGLVVWGTID